MSLGHGYSGYNVLDRYATENSAGLRKTGRKCGSLASCSLCLGRKCFNKSTSTFATCLTFATESCHGQQPSQVDCLVFCLKHLDWRVSCIPGSASYQQDDIALVRWQSGCVDNVHVVFSVSAFSRLPLCAFKCQVSATGLAGCCSCNAADGVVAAAADYARSVLEASR